MSLIRGPLWFLGRQCLEERDSNFRLTPGGHFSQALLPRSLPLKLLCRVLTTRHPSWPWTSPSISTGMQTGSSSSRNKAFQHLAWLPPPSPGASGMASSSSPRHCPRRSERDSSSPGGLLAHMEGGRVRERRWTGHRVQRGQPGKSGSWVHFSGVGRR